MNLSTYSSKARYWLTFLKAVLRPLPGHTRDYSQETGLIFTRALHDCGIKKAYPLYRQRAFQVGKQGDPSIEKVQRRIQQIVRVRLEGSLDELLRREESGDIISTCVWDTSSLFYFGPGELDFPLAEVMVVSGNLNRERLEHSFRRFVERGYLQKGSSSYYLHKSIDPYLALH